MNPIGAGGVQRDNEQVSVRTDPGGEIDRGARR